MKKFRQWFRRYWPFAKVEVQSRMTYSTSFFLVLVSQTLQLLIMYYLWKAVFSNSFNKNLSGFNFHEMVIYIFISDITSRLTISNVDMKLGSEIMDGSIAMNLIKPSNYQCILFFSNLGKILYQLITASIPIWIGITFYRFIYFSDAAPNIRIFCIYIFSVFLSLIISFLFNICFGMLAFYTNFIWGGRLFKTALLRLLSGQLIPLVFFPFMFQNVLKFLPFQSMNYIPVMIYLGKFNNMQIINNLSVQIFWVIILFIVQRWMWSRAINRLTVLGG